MSIILYSNTYIFYLITNKLYLLSSLLISLLFSLDKTSLFVVISIVIWPEQEANAPTPKISNDDNKNNFLFIN